MAADLLRITGVSAGYIGEDVLHDAALTVAKGEVVAVIGSNGAGRTIPTTTDVTAIPR